MIFVDRFCGEARRRFCRRSTKWLLAEVRYLVSTENYTLNPDKLPEGHAICPIFSHKISIVEKINSRNRKFRIFCVHQAFFTMAPE